MLIRSAGRFFAAASLRIDCSTIPRAFAGRTSRRPACGPGPGGVWPSAPPGTPAACPPAAPPPAGRSPPPSPGRPPAPGTPHTPVRLQHRQQRQQMLIAVRGIGRPLQLIAARGEEQMQLMRGDQPLEPRIRGPFNRCHNSSQAPRRRSTSPPTTLSRMGDGRRALTASRSSHCPSWRVSRSHPWVWRWPPRADGGSCLRNATDARSGAERSSDCRSAVTQPSPHSKSTGVYMRERKMRRIGLVLGVAAWFADVPRANRAAETSMP